MTKKKEEELTILERDNTLQQEDAPLELSLEEIREFKTRLELDDFELQLLIHYIRISIETLKNRYLKARSDIGRLLIKTAIKYKEEKVMKNDRS